MENPAWKIPPSPHCIKCGELTKFITRILDTAAGMAVHMYECRCGNKSWIEEKA
jgi:hypothetical protein